MRKESKNTTIQISKETKKLLDNEKLIPEENYESVVKRILGEVELKRSMP